MFNIDLERITSPQPLPQATAALLLAIVACAARIALVCVRPSWSRLCRAGTETAWAFFAMCALVRAVLLTPLLVAPLARPRRSHFVSDLRPWCALVAMGFLPTAATLLVSLQVHGWLNLYAKLAS